MRRLEKITLALLVLGGINWGLWGLFRFNLVDYIVGNFWIDSVIYVLIGGSAVFYIISWSKFFVIKKKK